MKDNRRYKIFIIIVFPLFRALLIGNTLFFMLSIWLDEEVFRVGKFFYLKNLDVLFAVLNALLVWGIFYLTIMIVFKRDEWFDRWYEFSRLLKLTVPLGACLLIYTFFEQVDCAKPLIAYGLFYGIVLMFLIIPVILFESVRLGVLTKDNKGYTILKSQCIAFSLFLLLPFTATHLMKVLFYFIAL